MSKLDRFLISENLLNGCPNICAITLDRFLSDHRLIFLRENQFDYGPTPFHFYHHWMELDGFNDFIKEMWNVAPGDHFNGMLNLSFKLKFLKTKIREWISEFNNKSKGEMKRLKGELTELDADIDKDNTSVEIITKRSEVVNSMICLNKIKTLEAAQKAKIKWSVEGDENSRFFHEMWNVAPGDQFNGMRNLSFKLKFLKTKLREWISEFNNKSKGEMKRLKGELTEVDADIEKGNASVEIITKRSEGVNSVLCLNKIKTLEAAQKAKIKWSVEGDENSRFFHGMLNKKRSQLCIRGVLRDGVWIDNPNMVKHEFLDHFKKRFDKPNDIRASLGCNSSFIVLIPKVPGANMVKDFRPISLIGCLYKIIAKIIANRLVRVMGDIVNEVQSAFIADRQILDSPFILNEVMHWCKVKKKQMLIFKVDFEKAYDSVRWDFLDEGNPLSPLLFILIMESLHLSFQRVVDAVMFIGININLSLKLSHMFYADDAVFLGHWNDTNIDCLVNVLECFYCASGLKVNTSKSKIMGVHVEGKHAASKLGCLTLNTHFVYLGTKVGGNMSKAHEWNEVVDKVKSRLSRWKLKTLSIARRLTLIKPVLGSIPIFYMSIYRVLSKKSTLWVRVVKAIHGDDGKVGLIKLPSTRSWNGESTMFWEDNWNNGHVFKEEFPILYALERSKNFDILSNLVREVVLRPISDSYSWSLKGSGDFSVASVRRAIDDKFLSTVSSNSRWVKYVPIRVNTLAWKVKMNALPVRFNISRRGIDIGSILCPVCDCGVETSSHLFFSVFDYPTDYAQSSVMVEREFSVASVRRLIDDKTLPDAAQKTRWVRDAPIKVNVIAWKVKSNSLPTRFNISRRVRLIARWRDVPYAGVESYADWVSWMENLRLSFKNKLMLEGVFYVLWWYVWTFRNKMIFDTKIPMKATLFDDIVTKTYFFGSV
nr:RNA-directed DNA polymerase, eukaryota [Tanacetum cinerariifolium]